MDWLHEQWAVFKIGFMGLLYVVLAAGGAAVGAGFMLLPLYIASDLGWLGPPHVDGSKPILVQLHLVLGAAWWVLLIGTALKKASARGVGSRSGA